MIVEGFEDFDPIVQSAALASLVKISLIKPTANTPHLLQTILTKATKELENAEVRDKAYLYWRLLSTDDKKLQEEIILNKLPRLESTIETFPPGLLEELLDNLGKLSSVFYKPASTFVTLNSNNKFITSSDLQNMKFEELQQIAKNEIVNKAVRADNLLDFDDDQEIADKGSQNDQDRSDGTVLDELNDLFSGLGTSSTSATNGNNQDLFGILGSTTGTKSEESSATSSGVVNKNATKNNDILDLF